MITSRLIFFHYQEVKDKEAVPLCENHDDERTYAAVHCDMCEMSLCRECYRTLHLNKRNR